MNIFQGKGTVGSESFKGFSAQSSFMKDHFIPFSSIFKKTFWVDLHSFKRLVFIILAMNINSILMYIYYSEPIPYEFAFINDILGIGQIIFAYLLVCIPFLIFSSASMISEEISRGTMLILVSKPVSKIKITLSKFLAILSYFLLIHLTSLGVTSILCLIKQPFNDMLPFFLSQLLYAPILLYFFGIMTMSLSMALKQTKAALLIPIIIILFIFLSVFMIKPALFQPCIFNKNLTYYEAFQVYHFDLGYHIMNVYHGVLELFFPEISQSMQGFLSSWGVYKRELSDPFGLTFLKNNYYTPLASLILLMSISTMIFIIGFLIFKKKDITS
ncbi:MAG: ABC transporter permease [Promethearchaeota archaeon]